MRRVSRHLLAVAVLLLLGEAVCTANLISYSTWPQARDKLMVMDETGVDPTVVLRSKTSWPTHSSISPAGLEETWILFQENGDLYKIRPDGSERTLVLCGGGTDKSGAPYVLSFFGQPSWSPDGSEILVTAQSDPDSAEFLAMIPAGHIVLEVETCTSELVPIHEPPFPWTVYGIGPVWNHDGSQIAFYEANFDVPHTRVAVIERQESGAWERIRENDVVRASPDLPDSDPLFCSWQPKAETRLMICRARDDYHELGVTFWLAAIDVDTGVWDYVQDGLGPVQMDLGSSPRWSSSGDQILFTDTEGDLVIWNYPNGSSWVIGSGAWADWQRDVVAGFCGDFVCAGSENQCNCALDCGDPPLDEAGLCADLIDNDCNNDVDCEDSACFGDPVCQAPYCGDGFCDVDEDQCTCPADCGTPPGSEGGHCSDGLDNDCDLNIDCDDTDCAEDTSCIGGFPGDPCTTGADCLSGLCHPRKLECK